MDIAVVWNERAGSAAGIEVSELQRRIAEVTGRDVTILEGENPCVSARAAVAAGARVVVAAGGDGTVSACATEVLGKAELGVLPLGTSNSFAAALEIPADFDAAIENLARTDRRVIVAAVVTSATERRVMILHCMVGFHAETIEETEADAKRRWGALAYLATALKKLASVEPFAVEITTGDQRLRCRAIAIAAANVAPLKTVLAHGPSHLLADDGRVDVTIVAADGIGEAIATGLHLYRTARDHEPATRDNVGSFSAAHVTITTEPPQRVLVDGESFSDTPISIETLPRVLTVIAPPAALGDVDPVEAPLLGLPDLEVERVR
ncbi:MAG TPA: diacylglycerol kinase family protein [Kofleriaceae bacterium]|nr:diacylglycerol kinase family protein [Kofleriaceae bacterium]